MKKIRWGIIGCGKVILKNKTTPFLNKKNTIVAICTTNLYSAKQASAKLNLKKCNCYDNAKTMIENEKIDCVYIATPPKFHYTYLKLLSNYNIPIYVEKPFVKNYIEAKSIKNLYQNRQLVFVAHYKRLSKQINKLYKLLKKEKIGKITFIEGIFKRKFSKYLYENTWIYDKDISGGGRFIDIAPHILDTLYFLFGEMKITNSEVIYSKKYNTEEIIKTDIEFNSCKCKLYFDFNSNYDEDKLIINGTKGKIITSINRNFNLYLDNNGKSKTIKIKQPTVWGKEAINEFNTILRKNTTKTNLCTINEACLIQKYIDIIMKK